MHQQIASARADLERAGLTPADAALDAEVLARHALQWDRATLIARGREAADDAFAASYATLIARRAAREPVALIAGHREFWELDFEVTPDVLVPRPETELALEAALSATRSTPKRIVDVGTGSGCLAVSLAVARPDASIVATDVSRAALAVARRNALRHRVHDRIAFVRLSLLDGISGPVDLIVSNPPYIPTGSVLPPEVARYEPPEALFAGPDGLDAIRALLMTAGSRLAPGGRFVVEFGSGQAGDVDWIARAAGWKDISIVNDLQQIPRVAVLTA